MYIVKKTYRLTWQIKRERRKEIQYKKTKDKMQNTSCIYKLTYHNVQGGKKNFFITEFVITKLVRLMK